VTAGYQCGLKHDKRGGESDSDDENENESGASGAGPAATSLASDPAESRSVVVGVPKIKFEGWLTKRGKRNKRSWRMRWFVLYAGSPAGTLCYYTAEDRKRQKGSITLEDSSFNPIDPNGDGQVLQRQHSPRTMPAQPSSFRLPSRSGVKRSNLSLSCSSGFFDAVVRESAT
jgi:hypothetical protein